MTASVEATSSIESCIIIVLMGDDSIAVIIVSGEASESKNWTTAALESKALHRCDSSVFCHSIDVVDSSMGS
jgi:hypothetical protein